MDDIKRKKNIVRLILIFLNLSFAATVVDIFYVIFGNLHTNLFQTYNVRMFHINGLDFTVYIPAWPVLLMIVNLVVGLVCLRFLYRFIRKCLKALK